MHRSNWAVALVTGALVCGSAMFVRAADEKAATAEKPAAAAKEKPAKAAKAVRLTKPWNQLSSLSDDQKSQIAELHKKAIEERKQVDQREHDAILAVLNDAQKKELEDTLAKEAADKKMKKTPAAGEAPTKTTTETKEKSEKAG